jgi:hypothetical protein
VAALLEQGGLARNRAEGFAAVLIAAIEGATVFSRAEGSLEPFDRVTKELLAQVRAMVATNAW